MYNIMVEPWLNNGLKIYIYFFVEVSINFIVGTYIPPT